MSDYKVHTIDYSGDLKPEGDGYAPQIVLTASRGRLENVTELNTQDLPFTAEEFVEIWERFNDQVTLARWISIFHEKEIYVHRQDTTGYSQGDYGESFVFGTPEFFQLTGATEVSESDHNDLCAWVWGDVYEVFEDDPDDCDGCPACLQFYADHPVDTPQEDETFIVYGMDEAMKYGDIEGL